MAHPHNAPTYGIEQLVLGRTHRDWIVVDVTTGHPLPIYFKTRDVMTTPLRARPLDRPARLRYIAQQLVNIRESLVLLTGSPRVAEVRMVRDLEMALVELGRQAARPRSAASTVRRWGPAHQAHP